VVILPRNLTACYSDESARHRVFPVSGLLFPVDQCSTTHHSPPGHPIEMRHYRVGINHGLQ
jgi:hypothetical protein